MKTFKKLTGFGAAFLMVTSMGAVQAEEGDMTQTRAEERIRTTFNLQEPTSDFGQSQNREEKMVFNKNQNAYQHQYQYKNMNQYRNGGTDSAGSSEGGKSMARNSWQGDNSAGSSDRMSNTNRSMQSSAATGSMNRQSTASRSAGGGRR